MSIPGFDRLRQLMSRPGASEILRRAQWPAEWPFSANDFRRVDESSDSFFYAQPRVGVFHIDEGAVRALTRFYSDTLPPKAHILDLCSSWVSHLPEDYETGSLTVVGMSQEELDANPRADRRVVWDLNARAELPFGDGEFDVVTNAVSVDYLTKPLEVFREMGRVLKPGGKAIMSFSNRCFPTKAIDIWCRTGDMEHVFIVGCYFHYSGMFSEPVGHDLKTGVFGLSDPMYVVEATRV